jgi:hypothetical protein
MVDILFRDQWGASAPLGRPMVLPAIGVHVHHSVTVPDDDFDYLNVGDVVADMLEIERIGIQRYGRFPYSFCGHPSGWVGEGAGLTVGAHTAGWNSTTLGYCLIGNYEILHVNDAQIRAFIEWRQWAVANGWLVPDHWIEPHRARKATACPGANTMARWDELIANEPPPPLAPPPAPPSFVEEDDDDMLIIESRTQTRGVWLLQANTFMPLASTETVAALLGAGVKATQWHDADFVRLLEAKGVDGSVAAASRLTLQQAREALAEDRDPES